MLNRTWLCVDQIPVLRFTCNLYSNDIYKLFHFLTLSVPHIFQISIDSDKIPAIPQTLNSKINFRAGRIE